VCHCELYVVDLCSTPHLVWMCAAVGLAPSSAPGCRYLPFNVVSLGRSVARALFSPNANRLPSCPARFLLAVLGEQVMPEVTAAAVPGDANDETAVAVAAVCSGWCLGRKTGRCVYGTRAGGSAWGC